MCSKQVCSFCMNFTQLHKIIFLTYFMTEQRICFILEMIQVKDNFGVLGAKQAVK